MNLLTNIHSVSIASIERLASFREERHDVRETLDLELLGLLLNDFPVEGPQQRGGVQQQGTIGQREVALLDGA